MSFDLIDKKFRPKEPIKLECSQCESTDEVAVIALHPDETPRPLCCLCQMFFSPQ